MTVTLRKPVHIGTFGFKTKDDVAYDLPAEVPAGAKLIRLHCLLCTGREGPERAFTVTVSTIQSSGTPYYSHISGYRYGQEAISYTSPELVLPLGPVRKVFVQCDDIQVENCHNLRLCVSGWA